ncbi:acyltransferase [Sphingomonas koreensis]|uniref:Acyltransferase n=1 Tax=Sphingomonas koreensis TaxID=93064 RepID=A0A430FZN3_9SPHN|nr:acyltransferase [Sphingomonas koreensis]RSY79059.1 acyltransferase [Sphingomonas koreensis]
MGAKTTSAAETGGERNAVYSYMDAARFVLAAVVAFAHAWHLTIADYHGDAPLWAKIGYFVAGFSHAAVILFFVLSGYWIARSVEQRLERGWSWKEYLSGRLTRIWIVLIPALLIGGSLDLIGTFWLQTPTHLGLTNTYVLRTDVAANLAWPVWIGNLFFLQDTLVHPLGTNGPLWSLAWEWWFYLWYPALILLWRTRRPAPVLIAMAIFFWYPSVLLGFVCWLLGTLVRVVERKGIAQAVLCRRVTLGATGVLGLAILAWERTAPLPGWEFPVALSFAAFLAALLAMRPAFPQALTGLAHYGSRASFSLYVTHFPVLAMIAGIEVGAVREEPSMTSLLFVCLGFLAALFFAYGFSMLTEANTGRVRKWLAGRRRPAP